MGGDVRNRLQYLLCAPMSVMRSALLVTVVFLAGANDHRHAAQVREVLYGAGQVIRFSGG